MFFQTLFFPPPCSLTTIVLQLKLMQDNVWPMVLELNYELQSATDMTKRTRSCVSCNVSYNSTFTVDGMYSILVRKPASGLAMLLMLVSLSSSSSSSSLLLLLLLSLRQPHLYVMRSYSENRTKDCALPSRARSRICSWPAKTLSPSTSTLVTPSWTWALKSARRWPKRESSTSKGSGKSRSKVDV